MLGSTAQRPALETLKDDSQGPPQDTLITKKRTYLPHRVAPVRARVGDARKLRRGRAAAPQ